MSIEKYDYYGNYSESKPTFTYSVEEIHRKQRIKEKERIKIYESILSRCYRKIKESAIHNEFFLFFQLPELLPGLPIYNMTECVIYIINSFFLYLFLYFNS